MNETVSSAASSAASSPAADALTAFAHHERARVLAALIRDARGDFDIAEDALSEACARAVRQWYEDGVPLRPGAWLLVAARRIIIDGSRRARTRNRIAIVADSLPVPDAAVAESHPSVGAQDERLALLFTCCHPALTSRSQLTQALRTIGGLTTREISRALLEPEVTTAQRLVRAKRKIRDAAIPFAIPPQAELPTRMAVVRETLYLVFNEGYSASSGEAITRHALADDAIALARLLVALRDDAESLGLLALMLVHHARRATRVDDDGAIVPLEEQDRARWDRRRIREGESLLDRAIAHGASGPYQLQAAIAALHATAATSEETDWRQIALLYGALRFWRPTSVVELNAAVSLAMLRCAGRFEDAERQYRLAVELVRTEAERRYLLRRLCELDGKSGIRRPGS